MIKNTERYKAFLKEHGIELNMPGMLDIALTADDALIAIEILRKDEIPVLGGDVYYKINNKIEISYENWYTEKLPDENLESYLNRGYINAIKYIKTFPQKENIISIFTIVI